MATEAELFSLPWPDTTDPGPQIGDGRQYTDAEWRQVWRTLVLAAKPDDAGVFNVPDDAEIGRMEVTSPGANQIQIDSGAACVDGLFVPNPSAVDLTPASAGAGSTRQDRVVLRATWGAGDAQYTTVLAIKQGSALAPPDLTQTRNSTWEISLASYTINDVGAISGLTDERKAASFADGGAVPIGGIILWSGALLTIPWNWALCDGSNGTPDLRDRFVMGAGNVAPGATGGANAVNLQHAHDQAATGSAGSHSHTQGETGYESSHTHTQGSTGSSGSHAHTQGDTGSAGSHTHTQNATGGAGGHTHYVSSTTDTKGLHAHSWPSGNYTVPYDPVSGTPVDLGAEHDVAGLMHYHVIPDSARATTPIGSHYHNYSFTTPNPGNHTHTNPNTKAAGSHSHPNPNTNSAGSHTHTNPTTSAGSSHRHTNPNTSTAPNHTHTNPTTANALSTSQDNRPAFYALAYIMRIA